MLQVVAVFTSLLYMSLLSSIFFAVNCFVAQIIFQNTSQATWIYVIYNCSM